MSETLDELEALVKHMVDRFLGWKLPENFSPDAGISFKPWFNENSPHAPPVRHEPVGTNLFDAAQAEAMVRFMLDGPAPSLIAAARRAERMEEAGCHRLDTPERVLFYENDFYVLSNFSSFRVTLNIPEAKTPFEVDFDTSEAAYHYCKFVGLETDEAMTTRARIRRARSAHDAFKIAEAMKAFRRPEWDTVKVAVMRNILWRKIEQHEYVRRKLLATGDRELIEDSWRDDFWGWGPNRDGQNMLGKLWMEVRSELRAAGAKP